MSEDEVVNRWGKPTSVNSPTKHFINPPEGFSYWTYQSRYRDEQLDGPAKPEDVFRLQVYFIHGRIIGSELESRRGVVGYDAHVSCLTSGVSATFSPPVASTNAPGSSAQGQPTLVSVLRNYRLAWIAGHDPQTPWAAQFVLNRCPSSLTPRLIAEALRYPGQLYMEDARGTDQRLDRENQPIWVAGFGEYSNTFARTHIFGYRQGTLLTPEVEQKNEAALHRLQDAMGSSNMIRRVELPGNVKGYISVGFGGCILLATVPALGLDIMLAINLPNGDAGPFYADTPETHEYYVSIHDNPVQLLSAAFPVILDGLNKGAQPTARPSNSPVSGSPSAQP
jgi:hypothetical protein